MSTKVEFKLTLLRHGTSTANHKGLVQGQQDFPLHKEGFEQAHSLGKYWRGKDQRFDLVVSSTLQRALETAQIISSYLQTPIVEDIQWIEKSHGDAEGMSYEEARTIIAAHHTRWPIDEPLFDGGESELFLYNRALKAINSLLRLDHHSILVVSHGAIMNAAMRALLGIPLYPNQTRPPGFSFTNTGFSELSYDREESRWTVHAHNIHPHMESSE